MKEKKQNQGIILLKIIGTFGVVFYHFFQQFIPGIINGNILGHFEYYMSFSPIYVLWNAQFFIALFWGISGFLLGYNSTYKYLNIRITEVIIKSGKRWLKFSFPFVITTIVSFVLLRCKLYANIYIEGTDFSRVFMFSPQIIEAIYEGAIGCFISNKAKYNPILWTMTIEFFEYFALFGIIAVINQLNWTRKTVNIVLLCASLLFLKKPIYMPMLAGFIRGYNYTDRMVQHKEIRYLCLIIAVFLAGYPFMHSKGGIYKIVPSISGWLYYSIGCIILIPHCFRLYKIQRVRKISSRLFDGLGGYRSKYTFAILLFNVLLLIIYMFKC